MAAAGRIVELETQVSKYERLVESMFEPEPDEKLYEIGGLIGVGGFGQVRKAKSRSNGKLVAIKAIRFDPEAKDAVFIRGMKNILSLKPDTNIVQFFDVFRGSQDTINYVMELCDCDLNDFMKNRENRLLKNFFSIAHQTVRATHVLHSNSPPIIHRDIKPHNVLLQTKPNAIVVKLGDFDLSSRPHTSDRLKFDSRGKDGFKSLHHLLTTIEGHGTKPFLGPEFFAAKGGDPDDDKMIFDSSSDIFALGLTFAYMFCYNTSDYGLYKLVYHKMRTDESRLRTYA